MGWEDSPTQAQKVATMLTTLYGLRVIVAKDGVEALGMASKDHPNAIVLDVNLPQMDGYQVCKRLKRDKNTAQIPVIMLTSSDTSDAALQGLESGADDYIPKDVFATENLIATLRTYVKFP
jgi:DNA-binding response OmpR family regulator